MGVFPVDLLKAVARGHAIAPLCPPVVYVCANLPCLPRRRCGLYAVGHSYNCCHPFFFSATETKGAAFDKKPTYKGGHIML